MANRLSGKTALVTGAASGMGKAITLSFLREGANVAAVDVNEARLEELKAEAAEKGFTKQLAVTKGNICNSGDCAAAVRFCVDKFGTCSVLSHNAGVVDKFPLVDSIADEEWDRVIAVNLTGTMKICRAALQYFVANKIKASLVLITSNAAFESATGGPAYTASKAGANALMKSIAFEYGRMGIRCNSICPGPVATHITDTAPFESWDPRGVEVHQKTGYNAYSKEWACMPIATGEHIAPLAVYLASDESAFVNAASIIIDGGVCLG